MDFCKPVGNVKVGIKLYKRNTFNMDVLDDYAVTAASCKDDFYVHENEDGIRTPPNILPPIAIRLL